MFRAIILPISRSARLCVTVCGIMHSPTMLPATGRQHREWIIPQAVTHSLVLLEMGKIIARNMLSWLELLINRYCCIQLVVYIIYTRINDVRPSKYQIYKLASWVEHLRYTNSLRKAPMCCRNMLEFLYVSYVLYYEMHLMQNIQIEKISFCIDNNRVPPLPRVLLHFDSVFSLLVFSVR